MASHLDRKRLRDWRNNGHEPGANWPHTPQFFVAASTALKGTPSARRSVRSQPDSGIGGGVTGGER
jgi:hypothetical protein